VGEISEQGRNTQGVRLMNVSMGEKLVSFEYMAESNVENGEGASQPSDIVSSTPVGPSGSGSAEEPQ